MIKTKIHRMKHEFSLLTQEAEAAAEAKENRAAARAAAAAERAEAAAAAERGDVVENVEDTAKSPSNSSWQSYELFVGQEKGNDDNNKERISIQSDGGDSLCDQRSRLNASKARKVSSVSFFNFLYILSS